MDSDQKNDRMIGEEQDVLDELIRQMDAVLLQLDRRLTQTEIDLKREREKCLADTYGRFIQLQDQRDTADRKLQNLYRIRDELYTRRMIFDVTESGGSGGGPEEDEIKVGLHTFMHQGKTWILSWKEEACRPFILNADLRENTCKIRGKDGTIYRTHYALKTSRDIDIHFTTVQDVTQLYPLTQEEAEGIIFDEFLKDLVERRADNEFKNIVFTIQKQQSEIIQSPYETNLIVQGCAGSGKSMIMLHRLPIILYDNASISRSSLYVITPSRAYIQMASNMCADLEIDDLNMGTLDDYYAYCIGKYVSVKSVPYGEADRTVCLTPKQLKYVYAKKRRKDIERMAKAAVKAVRFDYNKGFTRLGITNTS